ncbi:hypothetical protein ACFQMH_13160, partial [Streptomyces viridiviolaceus]
RRSDRGARAALRRSDRGQSCRLGRHGWARRHPVSAGRAARAAPASADGHVVTGAAPPRPRRTVTS